jgi:hypothetical protein
MKTVRQRTKKCNQARKPEGKKKEYKGENSPWHHSVKNITTLWAEGRRILYAAHLSIRTEHNQSAGQVMETYKYYYIYTRNKLYRSDHIIAGMGGNAQKITYNLTILK